MDWLRWQWQQHRVVILTSGLIAALFVAAFTWSPIKRPNIAASFGPDWECTPQPQSEPTCIKKIRP